MADALSRELARLADRLAPYRQELLGGGMLALALLALLNLLGLSNGLLPAALGEAMSALFGWGAIPVMLGVGVLGGMLAAQRFREEPAPLPLEGIVGAELAAAAALAVLHLLAGGDDPLALARAHGGGGYVGWG
ncbi:MAG: hypothetical protein D6796_05980, partial [Caldilineae bacterium]